MTGSQRGAIVAEISRLALGPGEVLIVRPKDGEWGVQACRQLYDCIRRVLPEPTKDRFIVVSEPLDLAIVAARLNS